MPRDLPLGNGKLLVNFDKHYNLRDVYWPHVGQELHTGINIVDIEEEGALLSPIQGSGSMGSLPGSMHLNGSGNCSMTKRRL